jgi:hypothetical protein
MAHVIRLRCHHCGTPLHDQDADYCPPCNLYLAYRAMPFLLGMILTGHLATDLAERHPDGLPGIGGEPPSDDDEAALIWE